MIESSTTIIGPFDIIPCDDEGPIVTLNQEACSLDSLVVISYATSNEVIAEISFNDIINELDSEVNTNKEFGFKIDGTVFDSSHSQHWLYEVLSGIFISQWEDFKNDSSKQCFMNNIAVEYPESCQSTA